MTAPFEVCSSCNLQQWKQYGERMVMSYRRYWPREVGLRFYCEGFSFPGDDHVRCLDLHAEAPWLAPWLVQATEIMKGRTDDFRHNLRFSHKVAALGSAMEAAEAEVLLWVDADVVSFAPVTVDWLDALFPPDADVALLTREPHYPETGLMMFRAPMGFAAVRVVVDAYRSGAVFDMEQQHDAYVVGRVVARMVKAGVVRLHSLSGRHSKPGHPWTNAELSTRMDHCKGKRKLAGRTEKTERTIKDDVAYWR